MVGPRILTQIFFSFWKIFLDFSFKYLFYSLVLFSFLETPVVWMMDHFLPNFCHFFFVYFYLYPYFNSFSLLFSFLSSISLIIFFSQIFYLGYFNLVFFSEFLWKFSLNSPSMFCQLSFHTFLFYIHLYSEFLSFWFEVLLICVNSFFVWN